MIASDGRFRSPTRSAVPQPERGRHREAGETGEPDVHARLEDLREAHDGDGEHRDDGDVDLARDHDERQPERHQADEDVRRDEVEEVRRA